MVLKKDRKVLIALTNATYEFDGKKQDGHVAIPRIDQRPLGDTQQETVTCKTLPYLTPTIYLIYMYVYNMYVSVTTGLRRLTRQEYAPERSMPS